MKRMICVFICLAVLAGVSVGCTDQAENGDSKLHIVVSVFPEYDWVREIVGNRDNIQLTLLVDDGVDLHSFQPSAADIVNISTCDMFIYTGGESEVWVKDVLSQAVNEDMVVVNLMSLLGERVKEEKTVEGMHNGDDDHHYETSFDEHIWLSLKNAEIVCRQLAEKLCELDAEYAETYRSNSQTYIEKLNKLDRQYQKTVDESRTKIVVFGDRFPFGYLTDDYGINYYAAFEGCSAETEVGFETITFLAEKIDEYGLGCILSLEGTAHKIAQTVVENTKTKDQAVLVMDSMQSTTLDEAQKGETYLSVMTKNLEILKQALN